MTAAIEPAEAAGLDEAIRGCLNGIVDPCSVTAGAPAGLVDMGLVSALRVEERAEGGRRAVIEIAVTHPFCMMAGVFLNEVRQHVPQVAGIDEVVVTLDNATLWTPAQMTDAYRARLDATRRRKEPASRP